MRPTTPTTTTDSSEAEITHHGAALSDRDTIAELRRELDQLKSVTGYLLDALKHHLRDDGMDDRSLEYANGNFRRAFLAAGLSPSPEKTPDSLAIDLEPFGPIDRAS